MRTLVLAVLTVVGVSACAPSPMIRSVDRVRVTEGSFNPASRGDRASFIGEYALPRSRFTVTLSAPAAAGGAAAATPSVTNTITVTTTSAPTANAAAGDTGRVGPDLAAWCRSQRESYNRRKRVMADAAIRTATLDRTYRSAFRLDERGRPLPGAPVVALPQAERTEWRRVLLAEIPTMVAAEAARLENEAAEDILTTRCLQPVRVTLTETVERDPERTIALYADFDDFASDQLSLVLDSGGFITNLSGTSSARSGEVLVGMVKSLAAVSTLASPFDLSAAALSGQQKDNEPPPDQICTPIGSAISRSAEVRRRLNTLRNIDRVAIRCSLDLLEVTDTTPEIDISLPREITFEVPVAPPLPRPAGPGVQAKADGSTDQAETRAAAPDAAPAPPSNGEDGALVRLPSGATRQSLDFGSVTSLGLSGEITCAIAPSTREENAVGAGLVTSTPTPCEIVIRRGQSELARANTWSLDSRRTTLLEVPRTPFITQTSGYTFTNGRQTGASWNRPSPAEQAVTFPIRVITAVVEGVAVGAQGVTADTDAETAQIKAETARLEALAALAEAREAIEADEDDEQ